MTNLLNPKVYVLTFTAFVMLSSEFIVAGLLPEIATGLHMTVGNAGWLITAFALGMGIGAPLIAAFTHRVSVLLAAGGMHCALLGQHRCGPDHELSLAVDRACLRRDRGRDFLDERGVDCSCNVF